MATLNSVQCAFCGIETATCTETRDDYHSQVYCLRAQGWLKAKKTENYYCPTHRCGEEAYDKEWTIRDCWNRHRGEFHPPRPSPQPPPQHSGGVPPSSLPPPGEAEVPPPPPPPPDGEGGFAQVPAQPTPWQWHGSRRASSRSSWQASQTTPASTSASTSVGGMAPTTPPLPPRPADGEGGSAQVSIQPPLVWDQCVEVECKLGNRICISCQGRRIPWTRAAHRTPLAEQVVKLTEMLNCVPGHQLPPCIVNPAGSTLARFARHDPEAGQGDDREVDVGNKAGSALMLAVLLPHVYGVPGVAALRVCGWPPPETLTHISQRSISGRGSDNRRMNVWEALLNYWYEDPQMADLRDLLLHTLCHFRVGIEHLSVANGTVWRMPRVVLQGELPLTLGARRRGLHGDMV